MIPSNPAMIGGIRPRFLPGAQQTLNKSTPNASNSNTAGDSKGSQQAESGRSPFFSSSVNQPSRSFPAKKRTSSLHSSQHSGRETTRGEIAMAFCYLQGRPDVPEMKTMPDYQKGLSALEKAYRLDAKTKPRIRSHALLEAERRFSQAAHHTPFEPIRQDCYQAAGLCAKLSNRPRQEQVMYRRLAKEAFRKSPFQLEALKQEVHPLTAMWDKLRDWMQGMEPTHSAVTEAEQNGAEQFKEAVYLLKTGKEGQSPASQLQALNELYQQSDFFLFQHLLSNKSRRTAGHIQWNHQQQLSARRENKPQAE